MAQTPPYGGFNPQVPGTSDPNYLNYSKVVDAPPADKTAGLAWSTAGDALTGAVGLADTVQKGIIDDKVRIAVEGHRDLQTQALERIRREQQAGIIPAGSTTGDLTSTADGEPTVPDSLDSSLSRAETLGSARTQGGIRVNDTYYTMQLNSVAKQLRAQYPGYRDYIDERFSKISGMDPANAYYKNLMQDINSRTKAADTVEARALKIGYASLKDTPDLMPYLTAVENKVPGAAEKLLTYVNQTASDRLKYEAKERLRNERRGDSQDTAEAVRTDFNGEFAGTVDRIMSTPFKLTGLDDPTTYSKFISDASSGIQPISTEQHQMLLTQLNSRRSQLVQYGQTLYNSRDYATKWKNPQQMQEDVKANLTVVDTMIDAIKNKEYGTAFEAQRRIQARKDDFEMQALSGPLAGWGLAMNWARSNGGDVMVNEVNRRVLTSNVWPKYQTALSNMLMQSITPDGVMNKNKKSLFADVVKLQEGNVPAESRVYDNLFDNVSTLTGNKATLQQKQEVMKYMFNPENWKLMDRFKADYVNEKGQRIPGRESIFVSLSNPAVTKAAWEIGKTQPELWSNYKNFLEENFKTIFQDKILEMNRYTDSRLQIGWNSDRRQFEVKATQSKVKGAYSGSYQVPEAVERTVRSLNWGLSNLAQMQDQEGTDTGAYLVNKMMQLGFRPGENTSGLGQQIMDNIANSKKSLKTRFEESFK